MSNELKGDPSAPTSDDCTISLLVHLSPLVSLGIIGPLVVWLIYKDKSPFVADQAKEALNFHITIFIACLILTATIIGILLLPFVPIFLIVYSIIAAMEANKGVWYRYPYIFRLVN